MWCLAGNPDVEVYEGDFRTIPAVAKKLSEADVVVSLPHVAEIVAHHRRCTTGLTGVACQ